MKRLADFVTQNLTGGAPFENQDFFDLETEKYDVMIGMCEGIARLANVSSVVISGMAISGAGPYDIAAGIVYLDTAAGKNLYRIPAQSGVTAGTKYVIPDSDNVTQKAYQVGGNKDFFREKRATLGANETGAIAFDPSMDNLPFIGDITGRQVDFTNIEEVAASRILGRDSGGGAGDTEELTVSEVLTLLDVPTNLEAVLNDGNTDAQTLIKAKVYQIGDWNMDANASVNVAHGLGAANIVAAFAMVRNDAISGFGAGENLMNSGKITYDGTNIVLSRTAAGDFDTTAYDSTSFNRGWVLVIYQDT